MDPQQMYMQEHSMGTTIMAACYDGGVILCADSRTSTGTFVANRVADKISKLANNIFICRSGSAADTQMITEYVRYFLHQHSMEVDGKMDVKTAANLVKQIAYNNKANLQAGMIVAGWDERTGGTVWGIPLGGTLVQAPYAIGGSGSGYITGFCDKHWKEGMTKEECLAFCVRAVSLAMARDGSSGGLCRTVCISKDGEEKKVFFDGRGGGTLPIHGEEKPGVNYPNIS
mmetsp:Transcript_11376/g.35960  ORF Transcript_11376/g.35960 Transcript_11376/m.35960 type:complete len:229 (-) Transcript_11376:41-727(-)|eukprot:CAMPEP_0182913258 /NCGR_PEP_ID=MMETSP0034_2-20130328/37944_1 /TAXON_ID=156128 /ORGANISM="Nephroselmis pyriformis, Strain CCMP717" /LENGTH=228 /DNA_ID=CAMNT_0025049971 /DNA_START=158 /DNA_END=844 /DNA_ORIENTATION=+